MNEMENNVQGGVCGEKTVQSRQGRRGQTLWWFRSKQRTQAAASKRHTYSAVLDPLTHQMLDSIESYLNNISFAATQAVAKGGILVELSASLAISIDTVAAQQK